MDVDPQKFMLRQLKKEWEIYVSQCCMGNIGVEKYDFEKCESYIQVEKDNYLTFKEWLQENDLLQDE